MDFFCGRFEPLPRKMPIDILQQTVDLLTDPSRRRHVFGCRVTAVALAHFWGEDPVPATRAALLHDITKSLTHEEQLTLCSHYGIMADDDWQPKTLHAITGSLVALEVFRETPEVAAAVRRHTTGEPGMTKLDKIIYIADYIEPSRDFPGVEELRRCAFENLDAAVITGLNMTINHLKEKGSPVSSRTQSTMEWMLKYADTIS